MQQNSMQAIGRSILEITTGCSFSYYICVLIGDLYYLVLLQIAPIYNSIYKHFNLTRYTYPFLFHIICEGILLFNKYLKFCVNDIKSSL